MPFVPVPLVTQVEQIFSYDGQTIEMVHYYKSGVAPTIAGWEELHVLMRTDWSNTLIAVLPSTLSWIQTKFTDLTTIISPTYATGTGLPFPGASASAQLPNNVALAVTKRTALRGRSYRGRSFFPGLTEATVTGNNALSTITTPILNFFNAAREYVTTTDTYEMVVVSRIQNGEPLIEGVATFVNGFTLNPTIDSQRRRLPGHGA